MKWLEKAYEARSAVAVLIPADPDAFKPLHSDPRFQDLLRRVACRDDPGDAAPSQELGELTH